MSKSFVASFSGGKDSSLALYRAIQLGYTPHSILTTYNTGAGRSWFHGILKESLLAVSDSLGIPITLIPTDGSDYQEQFEQVLAAAKADGVELCVFGDIDIQGHRDWCEETCSKVGIEAFLPLWQEKREDLVYEFVDLGFVTYLNVVNTDKLNARFLGKRLTRELAKEIQGEGADICGENGEYHTFVTDGPLFAYPVPVVFGEPFQKEQYVCLPISLAEKTQD